ncbi:hypothetical protein DQ04_03351070 [Trypanosoma grayi]|uniref:hypothetical protein n=1 Tax=Trypanosoma grayi TaxID=71804 RepID=UPI0004F4795E|nr:hypothetical protein DQ04_03351070 [Trypanosoma grayi]KEG10744.1 hypothetical protein DQ04_03351070 [Trypanosoma grayi]
MYEQALSSSSVFVGGLTPPQQTDVFLAHRNSAGASPEYKALRAALCGLSRSSLRGAGDLHSGVDSGGGSGSGGGGGAISVAAARHFLRVSHFDGCGVSAIPTPPVPTDLMFTALTQRRQC